MATFNDDWTTMHVHNWHRALCKFAHAPHIHALEIGAHEGRSSLWFLENILTDESSRLTCIDHCVKPVFHSNLATHANRVRYVAQRSQTALRDRSFQPGSFHFIYIDGDHRAPKVLEDAVLAFPLLIRGGVIIFDDYLWQSTTPDAPLSMPRVAIDAFLFVFSTELRVLYRGWQVIIEKIS